MRTQESRVLTHYQTVNPSRIAIETPAEWNALLERRHRIFQRRLHLPPQVFRDAQLLDLGCGTGEHTAVYAVWGAFVTGLEFNPKSTARFKELFNRHGLTARLKTIIEKPVSEWTPPNPPVFDIAVSDGVLHHLDRPREAFLKLAASIKPGGFMAISTAPIPGAEQRVLMRHLIQTFSSDIEDAVPLAKRWFPIYMDRAVRIGCRTESQVVSDNFLTPQNEPLPTRRIIDWLVETGLSLYRTWPPLEPDFADPAANVEVDWTRPEYREQLLKKAEAWAYHSDGDETRCAQRFSEQELESRRRSWLEESARIQTLLQAKDKDQLDQYLPTCRVFGRGVCGVGEWWIVAVKR